MAEFILHRTRQKYYLESERPSHLLALRLKECESKAYISAIKSSDDQVTTNPVAINDIFKGFYTNLYKAETDFDEPICKQYLDNLELPRISQMDKESLEAPLSMEELHVSLKSLQKGKSPGLDGLPPELYLEIWDLVGTLMLNSFNFQLNMGYFIEIKVDFFIHFRRCCVQSTLKDGSAQFVFLYTLLRIFTFSFYTLNVCTIYLWQKNTFGHWTPLH